MPANTTIANTTIANKTIAKHMWDRFTVSPLMPGGSLALPCSAAEQKPNRDNFGTVLLPLPCFHDPVVTTNQVVFQHVSASSLHLFPFSLEFASRASAFRL